MKELKSIEKPLMTILLKFVEERKTLLRVVIIYIIQLFLRIPNMFSNLSYMHYFFHNRILNIGDRAV